LVYLYIKSFVQILLLMKKYTFILPAIFIFLMLISCTNTLHQVSSQYHRGRVKVDGILGEWSDQMDFETDSKLFYGVQHDSENLYLALRTPDPVVQRKIMAFGMTLWLDTTAGRNQSMGLRYPVPTKEKLPPPETEQEKDLPLRARQAKPDVSRRFLHTTDKQHVVLIRFGEEKRQQLALSDSLDIRVAVSTDAKQGVSYEAQIPFDRIYDDVSPGKRRLSIGIVTGHVKNMDDPSNSLWGSNGTIGGGGRMGGASGSKRPADNRETFGKPTVLWLKELVFEKP